MLSIEISLVFLFFFVGLLQFLRIFNIFQTPRKAEIANLNCTVVVDQDVFGLQISVADFGLVKIEQAAKDIINYTLALDLLEVLV